MSDLITAVILILALSVAILAVTIRTTRHLTKGATTLIGFVAGVLLLIYLTQLWGHPRLSKLLPLSALVVFGNWFPLAAAFLAGITWTHGYGSNRRRVLFGSACFVISMYSVVEPLIGEPPRCIDDWSSDGYCLQSTMQTCSAAAAATLLRQYQIATSEAEMARLCLTRGHDGIRQEGTTWQGLYRGLKIKTAGHQIEVDVFEETMDEFVRNFTQPAIVFVGLPLEGTYPKSFSEEEGWTPGARHSVVVMEILPNSMLVVADPAAAGFEFWSLDELRLLWLGRGIRLRSTAL